jgi:hypothetical protein
MSGVKLDSCGRVELNDEQLRSIEADARFGATAGGRENDMCQNSVNTGCTNHIACGNSTNMGCINSADCRVSNNFACSNAIPTFCLPSEGGSEQ